MSESSELDDILQKICYRYFYSIIVIFAIFTIVYLYYDIEPLNYLTGSYTIFHIFFFFIPYRLSWNSIKPLISVYLIFLSLLLFPVICLFWQIGQITAFLWYFLIPLATAVFFSNNSTIYWSTYIFILICIVFLVAPFFPVEYALSFTKGQLVLANILTIFSCGYLTSFFVYYINKLNQVKAKHFFEYKLNQDILEEKREDNIDKYNDIYKDILQFFDKNKPYCDPEFTVFQLAAEVKSNITYTSKAIKINTGFNFSGLVNKYRIDMVKTMLENDYHNKYTMKYIYISAGFKHQSTFNKVFKHIEGVTPSEYIKNLELDKQ